MWALVVGVAVGFLTTIIGIFVGAALAERGQDRARTQNFN